MSKHVKTEPQLQSTRSKFMSIIKLPHLHLLWVLSLQVIVEWLDLKIKWISLIKITLSSPPGLFEINVMIHWYVLLFLCRLDCSRSSALYFLVAIVNPRIGAPLMTTLFHYSCTLWAQTKHTQGRLKKLRFSGKWVSHVGWKFDSGS